MDEAAGIHVKRYFLSDGCTWVLLSWITTAFSRLPSAFSDVSQPSRGTFNASGIMCSFIESKIYSVIFFYLIILQSDFPKIIPFIVK